MVNPRDVHVVRDPAGWAIQTEGTVFESTIYDTREEAIERAGQVARILQVEVVVHDDEGEVEHAIQPSHDEIPASARERVETIDKTAVPDPMEDVPGLDAEPDFPEWIDPEESILDAPDIEKVPPRVLLTDEHPARVTVMGDGDDTASVTEDSPVPAHDDE